MKLTLDKEMGSWTVRVNGTFVADFVFKKAALTLALNLSRALQVPVNK